MKRIPSDPAGSSLVPKTGGLSMKKWLSILLAALLLLPALRRLAQRQFIECLLSLSDLLIQRSSLVKVGCILIIQRRL